MILSSLSKFSDVALLVLRIGIGSLMAWLHGFPKIMGGPEVWKKVGAAMTHLGIDFAPTVFGLMAAATESLVAILFVIGFLFRPSCLLLAFVMAVATTMHLKNDGLADASHAIELGLVFLAMAFVGPGKYAVDK
jgi:putative oxidoreductase